MTKMDAFRSVILNLLIGSLFTSVHCNIFVSNKLLNDAVISTKVKKNELKELLKGYIDEELERMERTEGLIKELQTLSGDEIKDPTFKITHPFNAYRFIRNHSEIFNSTLMKAVSEISSFENDTSTLWKTNLTEGLAGITDLNGTVMAFIRLQEIYNISTKDFADGTYIDVPESNLSGDECRDVSTIMTLFKYHAWGFEWLDEAKHRKRRGKCDGTADEGLRRVAARSALKTGNHFAAMDAVDGNSQTQCTDIERKTKLLANRIKAGLEEFKTSTNSTEVEKMKDAASTILIQSPKYNSLCSGKVTAGNKLLKNTDESLSCRYDNNGHPYLILQPVKHEQLSSKPYIVVYHDVFTETDIRAMTNETKDRLQRSTTGQNATYAKQTGGRISASATISNGSNSDMLIDKVKAITSLTAGGEYLQIANYGVGGYFNAHFDGFEKHENNRIATFMVYLSDVDMGGATVFTKRNISIFPKKGTAVFWRNLHRNTTVVDFMTKHSSCPVIKGDKWVGTFWIRQAGQEFVWPCTLNRLD